MLKVSEKGRYIDLKNLPETFEIPIENIFTYNKTNTINIPEEASSVKNNLFTYEELIINESSSAIKFYSEGNSLLININGPKECKYREKAKNEACVIKIYTKSNTETKRESKKYLNKNTYN